MPRHSPAPWSTLARYGSAVTIGVLLLSSGGLVGCAGSVGDPLKQAGVRGNTTEISAHGGMVATANPYASDAAAAVLRAGGHAVDAAIAAHTVLGLVEPQSSGLGGGGFMLVYDAASGEVTSYNGREIAPAAADANLFQAADGSTLGFRDAWQAGLATGVPGVVALYAAAHADHGQLPWADTLRSAIDLASDGFIVSPRLAGFLPRIAQFGRLDENPAAAAYFYPGGTPLAAGDRRLNPAYAETLTAIAERGAAAFYTGEIAAAIVASSREQPLPGRLTLEDMSAYEVAVGSSLCAPVDSLKVCTAPAPSSGLAVIAILSLYDRLVNGSDSTAEQLAAFVDAQRLAYADRDHYIGDPRFGAVPQAELLQAEYLDQRATQRVAPADAAAPGDPGLALGRSPLRPLWGADRPTEQPSTTHLSIVDQAGNAVAFTASVEAPFGNSRFVHGFLLNNQLTDFRRPADGVAHANSPAGHKQPRSSMSPVIVFEAGKLRLVTGSPGGNSIIAYVAKSLLGSLRWQRAPEAAVAAPNIVARGAKVRVETATPEGLAAAATLRDLGYPVEEREGENSGLHLIEVVDGALRGAADPRREGTVIAIPAPTASAQ